MPHQQTIAWRLADLVNAVAVTTGDKTIDIPRENRYRNEIAHIVRTYLPSGAGIDNGVKLILEKSSLQKLTFTVPYHHMNADGYYTHWCTYTATVRPAFNGIDVTVSGPKGSDRETKDYIGDTVYHDLTQPYIPATQQISDTTTDA